jgi:hypothetical protein
VRRRIQGVHAFSPIAHSHPLVEFGAATSWEFWRDFDTKILSRCDELYAYCLEGWMLSVGMTAEIEIARQLGLPVRYVQP